MPTDDGHYTNEELTPELIPRRDSEFRSLYRFAMTFCRMYVVVEGQDRCVEITMRVRTEPRPTLTELRTALLSELRAWRFMGYVPPEEELAYLWGLVEKIRDQVAAVEFS